LEGAAEGEVEKKRDEAEGQRMHVGAREFGHVWGDAESIKEIGEEPDSGEEEWREGEAEVDAVD